jgi:hypothetical protein
MQRVVIFNVNVMGVVAHYVNSPWVYVIIDGNIMQL